MSAVPAATPVTSPVEAFTVATDVLLLLHDPPASPLEASVTEEPIQTDAVPVTVPALTFGLTVSVLNAEILFTV